MWVTATELNNLGFEVQRKMESNEFITIGFVKGSGTTSELHHYSYIDRDLAPGKYFYRLKQIDHNGQYEFSQVVDIEIILNYALEQNYPNPFNPTTKIRYAIAASSLNPFSKGEGTLTILKVFDILGNEVATLVNENLQPGVYEYEFDASSLTSGVYFYKLISGNFTEVKKMILMR
ncbi:MAG: T9SS type A sorting domain-containing protein [Ignavibacterium sp.]